MKRVVHGIEARYLENLREFLAKPGEEQLLKAYELGREALTVGLGVVDMAGIHHNAMKDLARSEGRDNGISWDQLGVAEVFFVECLSPFEMVHRGHEEANAALHRLNEVLEEETKRIAGIIHDEAGQLLANAYLCLAETERELPQARSSFDRVRAHLDQMRERLRDLSHELRPTILDDLGLLPALRFLADGVSRRSGLGVVVEGGTDSRLNRACETALYRIAQEALSNVVRHAKASQVLIRVLGENGRVRCSIRDNGRGFDASSLAGPQEAFGLGLKGIQERLVPLNGTLNIESKVGAGTELLITIPQQP